MTKTFESIIWSQDRTFQAWIQVSNIYKLMDMNVFSWDDVMIKDDYNGIFEPIPASLVTEGLEEEILEVING